MLLFLMSIFRTLGAIFLTAANSCCSVGCSFHSSGRATRQWPGGHIDAYQSPFRKWTRGWNIKYEWRLMSTVTMNPLNFSMGLRFDTVFFML